MTTAPDHAPVARPRVRPVSCWDTLGARFLNADLAVLNRLGNWVVPLAVGTVDHRTEPVAPIPGPQLERLVHATAQDAASVVAKTGLLISETVVRLVSDMFAANPPLGVVVDPELADRDGQPRASEAAGRALATVLLDKAQIVIANCAEAALLTGGGMGGPSAMKDLCKALHDRGPDIVIVTGGHLDGFPIDQLYDGTGFEELGADRVPVDGPLRGAGGVYSASIAGRMARGETAREAAHRARQDVNRAIASSALVCGDGVYDCSDRSQKRPIGAFWAADFAVIGV